MESRGSRAGLESGGAGRLEWSPGGSCPTRSRPVRFAPPGRGCERRADTLSRRRMPVTKFSPFAACAATLVCYRLCPPSALPSAARWPGAFPRERPTIGRSQVHFIRTPAFLLSCMLWCTGCGGANRVPRRDALAGTWQADFRYGPATRVFPRWGRPVRGRIVLRPSPARSPECRPNDNGCSTAAMGTHTLHFRPLFGPSAADEPIAGAMVDASGRVHLMLGGRSRGDPRGRAGARRRHRGKVVAGVPRRPARGCLRAAPHAVSRPRHPECRAGANGVSETG
jgi:hypothetical protein